MRPYSRDKTSAGGHELELPRTSDLKEDGNGAPSGAHPDSKSIVSVHISRNAISLAAAPSDIEVIISRLGERPFAAVRRTTFRNTSKSPTGPVS